MLHTYVSYSSWSNNMFIAHLKDTVMCCFWINNSEHTKSSYAYIFGSKCIQFLFWLTWPTFDVAVHLIVSGVYWFAAMWIHSLWCDPVLSTIWASYQIRKIAGCACAGNEVSDPDMHHGTCVTHVPWCMPGSLTYDGPGGSFYMICIWNYLSIASH